MADGTLELLEQSHKVAVSHGQSWKESRFLGIIWQFNQLFPCSGMAVGSLIWYQVHASPLILLALRLFLWYTVTSEGEL